MEGKQQRHTAISLFSLFSNNYNIQAVCTCKVTGMEHEEPLWQTEKHMLQQDHERNSPPQFTNSTVQSHSWKLDSCSAGQETEVTFIMCIFVICGFNVLSVAVVKVAMLAQQVVQTGSQARCIILTQPCHFLLPSAVFSVHSVCFLIYAFSVYMEIFLEWNPNSHAEVHHHIPQKLTIEPYPKPVQFCPYFHSLLLRHSTTLLLRHSTIWLHMARSFTRS
jgi:hypothetical protein